jgi:hypothetical protein
MKLWNLFGLSLSCLLAACSMDESSLSIASGEAALALTAPPIAPSATVAARAEPGGRILLSLSNPTVPLLREDTLVWDGTDTLHAGFESLPVAAGYRLVARYLDARGIVTHADSTATFALSRAEALPLRLLLRPVLGKVYLQFPLIPEAVDSLGIWATNGSLAWSSRTVRLAGGKALLRLDSLPLGIPLAIRLRAWNAAGDTLYFLDSATTLLSGDEQSYAWDFVSALARATLGIGFVLGGETSVQVGFPSATALPSHQTGRLLLTAFSDSGRSDWLRISNPDSEVFAGMVHLSRGSIDSLLAVHLAPGAELIVTIAGSDQLGPSEHPLHGVATLTSGIASVSWSTSGGVVWKLSDSTGTTLFDLVYVTPGKNGWPILSTSGRHTALLRAAGRTALFNDVGSRWCGSTSDSPLAACAD